MRTLAVFSAFMILLLITSCAFHTVRQETGNPIPADKVALIVDGKTTAEQILGWFGAPTFVNQVGQNDIYVYKNCKTGGGGGSVWIGATVGHTRQTERCNSLSVTIDRATGIVKAHNFQKMFDTE